MRLAFISTMADAAWGGSEELWAEAALRAVGEGHQVLGCIGPKMEGHAKVERLKKAGIQILVRPRQAGNSAARLHERLIRRGVRMFRTPRLVSPYEGLVHFQPDILCISCGHTFDLLWDQALQGLLMKLQKPYYIINQYNDERKVLGLDDANKLRALFDAAKEVFFVSQRNLCVARRQVLSEITNARVVRNPVNISDPSIIPFPDNVTTHFACVARLDCYYKGQEILIEILSSAKWKERNWKLNLYGMGPDEAYLQELVSFYKLSDRVVLKGHVTDIRRLWEENHLHLMPSTGEGTPLALVEAMLCGRPAVVTDVGGNAEIIEEGKTGFIAESASVKSFDKALEIAWLNKSNWHKMGKRAHEAAIHIIDRDPGKTLLNLIVA